MANTSVIVIPEGKICDYVDGKFRNDTPEEYVRQTTLIWRFSFANFFLHIHLPAFPCCFPNIISIAKQLSFL